MAAATVSETRVSKGFLTVVPSKVRRVIGVRAGDRLQWRLQGTEIMIRIRRKTSIQDIVGMISHGGDAVASKKAVQGLRPRVR